MEDHRPLAAVPARRRTCLPKLAIGAALMGAALAANRPALATPPPLPGPPPAAESQSTPNPNASANTAQSPAPSGFFTGLARRDTLLGSLGGLRPALAKYGISLTASETSEALGNATGGLERGAAYDGLTQMDLQVDTQRAFGLYGGTLNASALQIHGGNLSATNLGTLQTASGIEADPASRLWELWYDQQLGHENKVDLKIGQQSLDQEFMVSQNALLFVNTMFGWPMLPSADLPGGGPAYPLSALGVRARANVNDSVTVLGGVYNGSPDSVYAVGDSQKLNPSGLTFPLNGGALAIAEVQYAYPGLGALVYPGRPAPLSGTYRLGMWYDTEIFADLATGNPHRGNYAFYAVADQMVYQSPIEADRTLNFFTRLMGTPLGDRNLIAFSGNVGLTLHEPIKFREDDTLGIGFGYTKVGAAAARSDIAAASPANAINPIRNGETFAELTYQYQLFPWIQLQPDFQYVFHPGAGIPNPNAPTQRIGNEAVFGLRTIIQL